MKRTTFTFLWLVTLCFYGHAQTKVEVLPLTDQLISIFIVDGEVEYDGTAANAGKVHKTELDFSLLDAVESYGVSSTDDPDFSEVRNPLAVGRKSIGSAFCYQGLEWTGGQYAPVEESWVSDHWIYLELPSALKEGKNYSFDLSALGLEGVSDISWTFDPHQLRSEAIHVNTLGYAPAAPKYAYIYHWAGTMGSVDLSDFDNKTFLVIDENGQTAFEGKIAFRKAKNNQETGQPDETPENNFLGADVYEADFSGLSAPGNYRVAIPEMGCSFPFRINENPVWEAYYATARAIYHQRSGIRIEANYEGKPYIRPITQNPMVHDQEGHPYADKVVYSDFPYMNWDNADNGGNNTDQIIGAAEGNVLNVAGWYQDAGDWDSYAHHQRVPMTLMIMYEFFPELFADQEYDIPESGNGIPDIVDEASWLIKFNFRLRKALQDAGYSNGGVGGARVCADPYNNTLGNPEHEGTPSWQDHRPTLVTQADAFMTYMYAGEAAQFAMIIKKLGRDPEQWPVEMLDAKTFDEMTYLKANFIEEAEAAFDWAAAPENQPESGNNYPEPLTVYETYAAVNLFRLTGKSKYHEIAIQGLNSFKNAGNFTTHQAYAAYAYLLIDHIDVDTELQQSLRAAAERTATNSALNAAEKRAARWGGVFDMPMLVGQATTPWMFETMVAYALTGNEQYKDVVHTTADYFLGTNPRHSTNMTGIGPRPVKRAFNLDGRTITENWGVFPGWIPYGPWAFTAKQQEMAYKRTMADGIERLGGQGPWNEHWHNFSMTPTVLNWPGHERFSHNAIAPMLTENTIHQNSLHAATAYGFVNGRQHRNAQSPQKIGEITVSSQEINDFQFLKESKVVTVNLDNLEASQSALKWSSSETAVAHVDQFGRITATGDGEATITVETLDGSVKQTIKVRNTNLQDMPVEEVKINFEGGVLELIDGSTKKLVVEVLPEQASNKNLIWTSSDEAVVTVLDGALTAVGPGDATVRATAESDEQKFDELSVRVLAASYTVLADFDDHIPVYGEGKQPEAVEIFSSHEAIDLQADNPQKAGINTSEKVLKVSRGPGQWKLLGFSSPTLAPISMCSHVDFSFQYLSEDLTEIYYAITTISGEKLDDRIPITPSAEWQTVVLSIPASGKMESLTIFSNPEDAAADYDLYFDNFRFKENPDAEDCEEQELEWVMIDFETSDFNWLEGNGSFGWNGNGESFRSEVVDNPTGDQINPSERVFYFEKTGSTFGAGFGLQPATGFPLGNNTYLSLLTYSDVFTNSLLVKLIQFDEDGKEACALELHQESIDLSPFAWKKIKFSIQDMTFSTKDDALERADFQQIDQIIIQPDVAVAVPNNFYVDDIALGGLQVEKITIEGESERQMRVGEQLQLTVKILPEGAEDQEVVWQSTDESIASVDENGQVTALSEGQTEILAMSVSRPEVTASVGITIKADDPLTTTTSGMKIYPNPAEDQLIIELQEVATAVDVFNTTGQKFNPKIQKSGQQLVLMLNGLPQGIYHLKVLCSNGKFHLQQFIKK